MQARPHSDGRLKIQARFKYSVEVRFVSFLTEPISQKLSNPLKARFVRLSHISVLLGTELEASRKYIRKAGWGEQVAYSDHFTKWVLSFWPHL